MKKTFGVIIISISLLGMIGTAGALTIDQIDGDWLGTVGGTNVNFDNVVVDYGNGSEDQVRWGTARTNMGQSGLGFTGSAPPPLLFDSADAFEIGQLQHFNNTIGAGTSASEAFLTVGVDFGDPGGLTESFGFNFGIEETPNASGPPASDDTISFLSPYFSEKFKYDGVSYLFELLGFGGSSNSLISSFSSPEGSTNSTLLWGRITAGNTPVPEPATMLLLGVSLVGLMGIRSMKKK